MTARETGLEETESQAQARQRHLAVGYTFAALGAALFSSKAIFVKLAYLEKADASLLLALRMAFALPFFIAIGAYALRRRLSQGLPMPGRRTIRRLHRVRVYRLLYLDAARLRGADVHQRAAREARPLLLSAVRDGARRSLLRRTHHDARRRSGGHHLYRPRRGNGAGRCDRWRRLEYGHWRRPRAFRRFHLRDLSAAGQGLHRENGEPLVHGCRHDVFVNRQLHPLLGFRQSGRNDRFGPVPGDRGYAGLFRNRRALLPDQCRSRPHRPAGDRNDRHAVASLHHPSCRDDPRRAVHAR